MCHTIGGAIISILSSIATDIVIIGILMSLAIDNVIIGLSAINIVIIDILMSP